MALSPGVSGHNMSHMSQGADTGCNFESHFEADCNICQGVVTDCYDHCLLVKLSCNWAVRGAFRVLLFGL